MNIAGEVNETWIINVCVVCIDIYEKNTIIIYNYVGIIIELANKYQATVFEFKFYTNMYVDRLGT